MKKSLLFILVGLALSQPALATSAKSVVKNAAPNQYDCTVDELELYITKRTEDLRRDSDLGTWEDFKKAATNAKKNGMNSTNSTETGGDVAAEAKAKADAMASTGGGTGSEEDDCPLFYSDLKDLEIPDLGDLGGLISGGLSGLQDKAKEQMSNLADTLMDTVKQGVCKRLSTDYIVDKGTDFLDDNLKEEIGYTTKDITGGNFANEVLNDSLQEEYGASNAKLLNLLDPKLNNARENFIERQIDKHLDEAEDNVMDNFNQ